MASPASILTLHLPAGMHYECVRCGRSCGQFTEIAVDPAMAESIRSRPAGELEAAGVTPASDPIVPSPFAKGKLIMRAREDGRCCMLTGGALCALHKAFGEQAKPAACRQYPYRFTEAPDGVYVGLSFACTAVLGSMGSLVESSQAQIEALYRDGGEAARRIDEPVSLALDLPLSWEQYQSIEMDLLEMLQPSFGSIGQRLATQAAYLALLTRFLRQARRAADALAAGPEANEQALAIFRQRIRGTDEDSWPTPRRLAAKGRSSPLLRRIFLGFTHALRETYGQRRGRVGSYLRVVTQYFRFAAGRGSIALPGGKRPLPVREMAIMQFDPARMFLEHLLTRYFRHAIERKDLALAETVQAGHNMQLMHWGLIQWYAAALAYAEGLGEIDLEHLREAIRHVELFYGLHSHFDDLFSRYPLLRGLMDRLFSNPLYAFSMRDALGAGESVPADYSNA